ncbi:MAG: carbohydrate ABC transporter permease [Oscillospiraceae bacterium]|nr:carbohydrate ABC transporter permease [Oscillospiraceae bacterium]
MEALKLRRQKEHEKFERSKGKSGRVGKTWKKDIGIIIFLSLLGTFMLFPIYIALVASIKPVQEIFINPPKLYAINPTVENYEQLFRIANNSWVPFSRNVFNSVFVTTTATVLHVFFACTAAYILAKCRFPGVRLINKIIVVALLFNSTATYIMQYMVMARLGMIDTYMALIFPLVADSLGLFLMIQCIGQVPDSIIESAKVDGASHLKVCWSIVMPNSKPALMTIIIFQVQKVWNVNAGVFTFNEAYKTIPTVIAQIAAFGISMQGALGAAAVFLMTPPIIIFIISQSQVMETMAHAGLKE